MPLIEPEWVAISVALGWLMWTLVLILFDGILLVVGGNSSKIFSIVRLFLIALVGNLSIIWQEHSLMMSEVDMSALIYINWVCNLALPLLIAGYQTQQTWNSNQRRV